jgi:hypothetical protein
MKTAEDFLRENNCADFETLSKKQLKKARMTAIALGSAIILSLIFLVFAFIQKAEADRSRDLLERSIAVAEAQRKLALESKMQAEMQMKLTADHDDALMHQLQAAQQLAMECERKRK